MELGFVYLVIVNFSFSVSFVSSVLGGGWGGSEFLEDKDF